MVYVHLAEGFEEIEAVTIVDVLRRAEVSVQTVSIMGTKSVTGAHGIDVTADLTFEEADYEQCEMIVLPGGMPGSKNLGNHQGLTNHIRCFSGNDKYIAAICAAPMVFGAMGVLKDKKAVIYPGMEEHLKGAIIARDNVAVDGKVITSRGPATAMEFSLKLAELLKGKNTSTQVAEGLLWNRK